MKPPCTRNIKRFEDGCPERSFNPNDGMGCPLWLDLEVPTRENPLVKKKQEKCIDLWYFTLQWSMLGYLEGNQQATETFRNAMCESDPDSPGGARPKTTTVVVEMVQKLTSPGMLKIQGN